ncbi:MAG: hypothetical protein ACXWC4_10420 [Telluria sp.]
MIHPAIRSSLRAKTHKLVLAAIVLAGAWSAPAWAYRPFDGTDGDVAEAGVYELEFSPVGYLHQGTGRTLMGPAIVNNFGLPGDFELVIEGRFEHDLGDTGGFRNRFGDTGISVKHVLRRGSLQGASGLSIAMECGALLPEAHGDRGTGAACDTIASQKFGAATVHMNVELARNRDHSNGRFVGVIIEGNSEGVRPVMEVYNERDNRGGRTNSALIGAIWQKGEGLAFDAGIRRAREDKENVTELRVGLTWSFQMHK